MSCAGMRDNGMRKSRLKGGGENRTKLDLRHCEGDLKGLIGERAGEEGERRKGEGNDCVGIRQRRKSGLDRRKRGAETDGSSDRRSRDSRGRTRGEAKVGSLWETGGILSRRFIIEAVGT